MLRDVSWLIIVLLLVSISCSLFNNDNEESEPEIPGKLVFSAPDENGRYQIYTSFTNGTNRKQLTSFKNDEAVNPAWSPDGEQVVFVTTLRSTSGSGSLYLMNADGSNMRPLKERPNTDIVTSGANPTWSPDGSKIAFDRCTNCERGGRNSELFVYDFETDAVLQVTEHLARDFASSWANEHLLFLSNRPYYNSENRKLDNDLFQINSDGTSILRITSSGKIGIGIWNPNTDSYLIRSKVEPYEWYSIESISGDTLEEINLNTKINILELRPIKWSKDGQTLMLLTIDFPIQKIRFYDFKEQKLSGVFEIKNFLGIDWIQSD